MINAGVVAELQKLTLDDPDCVGVGELIEVGVATGVFVGVDVGELEVLLGVGLGSGLPAGPTLTNPRSWTK